MKYIEDQLNSFDEEKRNRVLSVLAKYGDNKWWRSDDPIQAARYQIFEPMLLIDFGFFKEGLSKLLCRPVYMHELGFSVDKLKEEAEIAIAKLENGDSLEQSIQYVNDKTQKSVNKLADYAVKNGKGLIAVTDDGNIDVIVPSDNPMQEQILDTLDEIYYEKQLDAEEKDQK